MDIISKFKARGESGQIYTVLHIQDPGPIHRPVSGPPRQLQGLTHFQLETGAHVNKLSETEYEIVYANQGNERITRVA
jgi:hypothetical protein